jgi:hypothetical protein
MNKVDNDDVTYGKRRQISTRRTSTEESSDEEDVDVEEHSGGGSSDEEYRNLMENASAGNIYLF